MLPWLAATSACNWIRRGWHRPAFARSRCPPIRLHRFLRLASFALQDSHVTFAASQVALELSDSGVGGGHFLPDHQCDTAFGLRLGQLARLEEQPAEIVVACRQADAEVGDAGVIRGQLLANLQGRAFLDLRLRQSTGLLEQDADAIDRVPRARRMSSWRSGAAASTSWSAGPAGRQTACRRTDPCSTGGSPVAPAGRQGGPRRRIPTQPGPPAATPPGGRSPLPRSSGPSDRASRRPRSDYG